MPVTVANGLFYFGAGFTDRLTPTRRRRRFGRATSAARTCISKCLWLLTGEMTDGQRRRMTQQIKMNRFQPMGRNHPTHPVHPAPQIYRSLRFLSRLLTPLFGAVFL